MKCEFCSLSETDKKYFLCDTDFFDAYLADNQNYVGRCIIVCKRHCQSIKALNDAEWLSLKALISKLEDAIRDALGADMFNCTCLMNDVYKQKSPDPHLHFHLIPRYSKPVEIGNSVYVDKEWAHHYNNKAAVQITQKDIDTVFDKIKACLNS